MILVIFLPRHASPRPRRGVAIVRTRVVTASTILVAAVGAPAVTLSAARVTSAAFGSPASRAGARRRGRRWQGLNTSDVAALVSAPKRRRLESLHVDGAGSRSCCRPGGRGLWLRSSRHVADADLPQIHALAINAARLFELAARLGRFIVLIRWPEGRREQWRLVHVLRSGVQRARLTCRGTLRVARRRRRRHRDVARLGADICKNRNCE